MALAISLCRKGVHSFPNTPVKYSTKIKLALVFDATLITTFLVVGILAIIGSAMPSVPLHELRVIGTLGGGLMIVGGAVIGLIDYLFHSVCVDFWSCGWSCQFSVSS